VSTPAQEPAQRPAQDIARRGRRPAGALVAVAILVLAPIVALMWVGSYARETPRLWGMPFFFWYQFLWVFLAAACTYAAYRIVLGTAPRRPEPTGGER
jgi:membrane protein implicated in regulation of membrane protease activity